MGNASESDVVQINRAQSSGSGPGYVGCGLQDVKLCSQSGSEIAFGRIERFIRCLHVLCFTFEDAVGLLKIEKRAAHFRGNAAPRRCQGLNCRLASGARRLHASFGRKSVEDVPSSVYSYNSTIVKFRTDIRVSLAVNFIP